jgi:hypothetical protein
LRAKVVGRMIAERPNPVNDTPGTGKWRGTKENGATGFPVAPFLRKLAAYLAAVCAGL